MADTHLNTDECRIEATVCNFYGSAVSHASSETDTPVAVWVKCVSWKYQAAAKSY